MKRRLFTLAAAVSLVLCLATVGLWARSYHREQVFSHTHYETWRLRSIRGQLEFVHVPLMRPQGPRSDYSSHPATEFVITLDQAVPVGPNFWSTSFRGFGCVVAKVGGRPRYWATWFPHLFLALLLVLLPALYLRATIRSLRPLTTACS